MHEKKSDDGGFTIGELSRRTGVNVETIRYYERIRLLPRPPRTRGGHRAYGTDGLKTLSFIRRARELGFGLDNIRALLALRASRGCCSDVKEIAERHLDVVRTKMRDLVELEKALSALVARCPGDQTTECPVLDVLEIGRPDEPRVSA
jgi:MerR family mercuric resistance operon transcriptional regulator